MKKNLAFLIEMKGKTKDEVNLKHSLENANKQRNIDKEKQFWIEYHSRFT